MTSKIQCHVFCCGVQHDLAQGLDNVVRSRQYVASLSEWSMLRGHAKAPMTLAVYDCPDRDFYTRALDLLSEPTDDILHLVYRCHGGLVGSDDLKLWMLSEEYDEVALVRDIKVLLDQHRTVVVWLLACYAGAVLDSFRDHIGRHPKLLVLCSSNKWEKSSTQVYDHTMELPSTRSTGMLVESAERENYAGKIELVRMINEAPHTRWCDAVHFRREQRGPVNTYPCYGNWSLYPFSEPTKTFDFVQPIRFQPLALSSVERTSKAQNKR